jgi:hypothetical protein
MDEIAMTCANISGVQLAIINIPAGKPLLYQYYWEMIHFIGSKKLPTGMHAMHSCSQLCMGKLHQFSQHMDFFLPK